MKESGGFSQYGKLWVDSVRKCLQEKFVKLLNRVPRLTCEELTKEAFETHEECYVKPGVGSYCNLSCRDMLGILKATGEALVGTEAYRTWQQGFGVEWKCFADEKIDELGTCFSMPLLAHKKQFIAGKAVFRFLKFIVTSVVDFVRSKRSATLCDDSCVANKIVDQVFDQIYPPGTNTSVTRFVFYDRIDNNSLVIKVWISDRAFLTVNENATLNQTNMDEAANEFVKTVVNEKVFKIGGKTIPLAGVSICGDRNCTGDSALNVDINNKLPNYLDILLSNNATVNSTIGNGN